MSDKPKTAVVITASNNNSGCLIFRKTMKIVVVVGTSEGTATEARVKRRDREG